MPDIQLLDEATIEKIAAGEVVERPASVIKELVENAIDAQATFITVEIKEGGMTFLRVTDNGCGIAQEQVRLAFLRHSTSKIRGVEDLFSVKSLGFRGEALASISAVAQVELITRTRGALTGVRYCIEGSKETAFEEVGAPEGTTFLVRNLFFNTPVRRRFLKTAQTEAGYVSAIVEHLALSHPEISFQLIVNNQPKLHTSGNCSRRDLIFHIYGRDIAANLLEIDGEGDGIRVSGFIGKPLISRGNRNFENYYVNGRYMKSSVVAKAIEEAYKPYLMQRQYPFTVLYLTMDEERMDVNVHPTKMEVRFSDGELLYKNLVALLRGALSGRDLVPEVSAGKAGNAGKKAEPQAQNTPQPFERARLSQIREQVRGAVAMDSPYEYKYEQKKYAAPAGSAEGENSTAVVKTTVDEKQPEQASNQKPDERREQMPALPDEAPRQLELTSVLREESGYHADFIAEAKKANVRLIGQLFETYWLAEADDTLFLIDQHAAHEKVLFERNMKKFAARAYASQQLSPPIILSLTPQEQNALRENLEELKGLGFEIEEFGGREYAVLAVPDNLYGVDAKSLFFELLDDMVTQPGSGRATPELLWNKVATASCKAAIKGNQRISRPEAEALVKELLTLENPYHCPHGRPTMIAMSKYEIEKKFKRIL